MKASAQAWNKLITLIKYNPTNSLYQIPLNLLHSLSPDLNLSRWTSNGVNSLQDILQGVHPKSFCDLQQEFHLLSSEHFTYLGISHCLNKVPLPLYAIPPKTWEYLALPSTKTKGISHFYNLLHHKHEFIKLPAHLRWESDLARSLLLHSTMVLRPSRLLQGHKMFCSMGIQAKNYSPLVHDPSQNLILRP